MDEYGEGGDTGEGNVKYLGGKKKREKKKVGSQGVMLSARGREGRDVNNE